MRSRLACAALVVGAMAGLSCGDGTGPRAGNLTIRLISPNSGADSAIVITVTGPEGLTGVTPGAGLRLFQQPLGGTTTRFALVGQLNNNATILTVGVTNTGAATQYSGSVNAVALPTYQLRSNLSGYGLAIIR